MGPKTNKPEEFMTLKDVAQMLNVHPQTVYGLIKKANLPAVRLQQKYRFRRESVEQWIRDREQVKK